MKGLKKSVFAIILLPVMLFCGCSKSNLKPQDFSAYYASTITCTLYDKSGTKTIPTSALADSKPNIDYADKYVSLVATAKSEWLYKMYIESIYFYVYTSESTSTEMIINVSLTNVVKEEEINTSTEDNTITAQCSFFPQKDNSTLCKVEVNRTVATATSSTLTFDINNSVYGIVCDENGDTNDFKWLIYGIEIIGESRTYNEK